MFGPAALALSFQKIQSERVELGWSPVLDIVPSDCALYFEHLRSRLNAGSNRAYSEIH